MLMASRALDFYISPKVQLTLEASQIQKADTNVLEKFGNCQPGFFGSC